VSKPRRKHNHRIAVRRKPKQFTKAICVAYDNGVGRHVGVALRAVSVFGAGLAVAVPPPVGSEVAIGLWAFGEPRPSAVTAKVVWCGPLPDGGYRIGAQFR
jgi:hypothetical protein